jgi:hypothetical protein
VLAIAAPPHGSFVAGFSGSGSGTTRDPYIITNENQLQEMKDNLTAHYALGNDIDASGTLYWNGGAGFEPVGTGDNWFVGSLDGRGYKIYDLYIYRRTNFVSLFGSVGSGGVVENVGLENVYVVGRDYTGTVSNYSYSIGNVCVGGLVGFNDGTVSNCYSTGSVNGSGYDVGGLVGWNDGTISNCYSTGYVSGDDCVGGLVGSNWDGTISNCYSTGSVNGSGYDVGGLVGYNFYGGTVSNCYSTGSVSGDDEVGGLVGYNFDGGTVSNSFWDIETSGQATSDGGTGKTTENMKNVRTYTDNTWSVGLSIPWDFVGNPYDNAGNEDIWGINPDVNDGYPFLTGVTPAALPPEEFPWGLAIGIIAAIVVVIVIVALLYRRRH